MIHSKFTKDEIQKVVLSSIGFVVLLYVYFSFFLGPLTRNRVSMEKQIDVLQSKLANSKSEISKAANVERQASAAITRFAALKERSPEGAPIAWFPPRMRLFFANQTIERVTARLEANGPYPQPELAEWARYTWLLHLPQTDFVTLGRAVAQLENSEPLLAVTRLNIRALADNPQFQQVSLTANTTVLQQ